MWLQAKIAGPFRGTWCAPSTVTRKKTAIRNRTSGAPIAHTQFISLSLATSRMLPRAVLLGPR